MNPRFRAERTGLSLQIDAVTIELTAAFTGQGIPSIVLKGPSIARRLYESGERGYVDSDLLVPRHLLEDAEWVLRDLGFHYQPVGLPVDPTRPTPSLVIAAPDRIADSMEWMRLRDDARVDLHYTIAGTTAPPNEVWDELWERSAAQDLRGTRVFMLDDVGLAFHIALHKALHDATDNQLEDLRRALDRFSPATWRAAYELAQRLGAERRFVNAIAGSHIGDVLGVSQLPPRTARDLLEDRDAGHPAVFVDDVMSREGIAEKAKIVGRKLFPPMSYVRATTAAGPRSGLGIYLRRQVVLLTIGVRGLAAWFRAKRTIKRDPP